MNSSAPPYQLIYWPGMPGRGEQIRLVLEETGTPYTDSAQVEGGVQEVLARIGGKEVPEGEEASGGAAPNPPALAPPILKRGSLVISQTPNILLYLGQRLGLAGGDDPDAAYKINGLALTALDGLSTEVHECHHPIAPGLHWEDQIPESKRRSDDYVKNRLPKFLGYFEAVLGSKASMGGRWLYGGKLSYADLVLFQCMDGLQFVFPKAMATYEKKFAKVFALHTAVKERPNIKAYLASPRRQAYSNAGIYRYYKELDIEP